MITCFLQPYLAILLHSRVYKHLLKAHPHIPQTQLYLSCWNVHAQHTLKQNSIFWTFWDVCSRKHAKSPTHKHILAKPPVKTATRLMLSKSAHSLIRSRNHRNLSATICPFPQTKQISCRFDSKIAKKLEFVALGQVMDAVGPHNFQKVNCTHPSGRSAPGFDKNQRDYARDYWWQSTICCMGYPNQITKINHWKMKTHYKNASGVLMGLKKLGTMKWWRHSHLNLQNGLTYPNFRDLQPLADKTICNEELSCHDWSGPWDGMIPLNMLTQALTACCVFFNSERGSANLQPLLVKHVHWKERAGKINVRHKPPSNYRWNQIFTKLIESGLNPVLWSESCTVISLRYHKFQCPPVPP